MPYNRTGYAPWSLTREAGVESATVDGTIEVPQYIQPVLSTGFVDEKGDWKGVKSSDKDFQFYQKDEAIGNGATFITHLGFDMTGYQDVTIAIKPTNAGNYAITACMGSDGTNRYANLSPLDDASTLRGTRGTASDFDNLLTDSAETLAADVWNILMIKEILSNQKLLQFKITNNSGGNSTVETCFLRSV